MAQRRRVLCVQRTGWGKSAVYFIATALMRSRGAGPTLLISPLIALMRNQVDAARRLGLEARTIHSANRDDWQPVFEELEAGNVDLLLISPERLNNPRFREEVLPTFIRDVGLLVVDEAHCISDWGHDFRPDYRRIAAILAELPYEMPVLCTTATANDRVVRDIEEQLGARQSVLLTIRGELDRPALRLEVVDLPAAPERLAWLATHLPSMPGSGIVYCLTVRDTELVTGWLRLQGLDVAAYSGESDPELRPQIEDRLLRNELKAVVATSALGMGYDKPDLGFVVHFQSPGSPIAYYQQVGRAGRQIAEAHAVLLRGAEDRDIQDYFIDVAFPPRRQVEDVMELLGATDDGVAAGDIEAQVNIRRGRLVAMLKILEVEGAVVRDGSRWRSSRSDWAYDGERVERVTEIRREEQRAMRDYGDGGRCLMQSLREALDDPSPEPCGRCAICTSPRFTDVGSSDLVVAAVSHVRDRPVLISPRKRWPPGFSPSKIPEERRAEEGRALSVYGDAGWGRRVARGKREDGSFDDDLVHASAELLGAWAPDPAPTWVTAVPSLRHPTLVPDFALRLASALGLPYVEALRKAQERAEQAAMENSSQQAKNVLDAFQVQGDRLPAGPVLLVDDIRDSGWTLTVIASRLREAGVATVLPFVLAFRV